MTEVGERLDDFSRRLEALERELEELRRLVVPARPAPREPSATVVPPAPVTPPAPVPAAPAPTPTHPVRTAPRRARREIDWSLLLGAKALAWAGGAVTLLGIVFFFVLAVNRGWIGPIARVTLGALASTLVFGAGLYIKRRFEDLYHSALAAIGVGIAGGYATLLAATALYDLVPSWAALLVAAAIAGVGVATALSWSSELVAGLGLIGATLAPAAIAIQNGELSTAGTGFVAIVFAGTAIVAIGQRWRVLLVTGVAASLPQVVVLIAQAEPAAWAGVAMGLLFALLYLGAAVGWQERRATAALSGLPASLVLLSGVLAGVAVTAQLTSPAEGWALLVVAAAYGAGAAALFPTRRHRDLSALLAAVGLALAAFALADLLSGPSLAVAWAAEAAVLAWLARRIDEPRYELAAFAYLAAALLHAVTLDAPPTRFADATSGPAHGALAFVGIALSAAILAWYCRPWSARQAAQGIFAPLEPMLAAFREGQRTLRSLVGWTGALAALYASSLGVLAAFQSLSSASTQTAFEWGHVGVTALWALAAIGVLAAGLRFSLPELRAGGLVWLAATFVLVLRFDGTELHGAPRGIAYLIGAGALLAGALVDRSSSRDQVSLFAAAGLCLASIGFGVAATLELVDGQRAENTALLLLACFYALVAALVLERDRDLSAFLWAPALAVAAYASFELLDGTWLVLAWAGATAGLAVLGLLIGEKRFQAASSVFLVLAAGQALAVEAPPSDLFEASRHPESGLPSVLLVIGAALVLAATLRGEWRTAQSGNGAYDELSHALESRRSTWRRALEAGAAVLCVYSISLAILGVAEAVGGASVATNFQRGHSAVSAFWGVIGLAVLYVGLKRRLPWLRLAGFGLFGIALAKLFLYDLAYLSSITRALSFLAVGAVLLIAGFFVQRLSEEQEPSTT